MNRPRPDAAPLLSTRAMQQLAGVLFTLAALLGATAAVLWLVQRPVFDLRRIDVQADARGELRHVTASTVRAVVAGRLHGNFFTLRPEAARAVFEEVPWVARAAVRKVWPDRLQVTLIEHRALGLWDDGRLLSDAGRLFVANPGEAEIYGRLVDFAGPPEAAAEAARRHAEFARLLAPLALEVAELGVSERAAWRLRTLDGLAIELGRDEPVGRVSERMQRVAVLYPQLAATLGRAPTRIDARYDTGLAAAPAPTALPSTTRPAGRKP